MSAAEQFLYDAQAFAVPAILLLLMAIWALSSEWSDSNRRDRICGTCSYCKAKREGKDDE